MIVNLSSEYIGCENSFRRFSAPNIVKVDWVKRSSRAKQTMSINIPWVYPSSSRKIWGFLRLIADGWCLVDSNTFCQRKTENARSSTKVREYLPHPYWVEPEGDLCRLSTKTPKKWTKFIPYLIAPVILLVAAGIAAALLGTVFSHSSTTTGETSKVVVERILSTPCFRSNNDDNNINHYKWVHSSQSDSRLTFVFTLAYTSASQCPWK